MPEKPAGIWRKASEFRTMSRFIPTILSPDRNKIPYDPCALERSPYNSPPDIAPQSKMSELSGLYAGFQVPCHAK
ncbi:hypothetical protein FJP62_16965 [Pantoea vagans]|nr:hypothetical protein FJP62_16965 [Pantoea vagans]